MRIPYCLIPAGFMEEAIVARSRSMMHSSLYNMEFEAVFGDDSHGFFKRTIIERCVSDYSVLFEGFGNKKYVIAIDPAAENDNFAVVVLEAGKTYRKVVNCWTTNRKSFRSDMAARPNEDTFYDYAARKILDLVDKFSTNGEVIGIAVDSQGGGMELIDRLHSSNVVNKTLGELPIWRFIDPEDPKHEDGEVGRHIIEGVQFADSEYTSNANHGLRLDLENQVLSFPRFDGLVFAEIDLSKNENIKNSDIVENTLLEIEELKNELSSIVMTQTAHGRDRWDTPDEKLPGAKKGRMRKDRYSALLMANALAKKLFQDSVAPIFDYTGGFASSIKKEKDNSKMFTGGLLASKLNDLYND